MQLTEYLKDIADAIRENTGKTEPIAAQNFKDEITKFSELDAGVYAFSVGSGGTGVNDATVNTLPGNLVLAFVCVTTDVTYPDLEGWTKIEPSIVSNTNRITDEQMDIWYKITESNTESIHVSTSASTNLATALMSFKNMQIIPILDQVKGGHSATFTDIKKGDLICCVNPWYSMSGYMKEPYSINIKCNKYLGWYKYYFTIFEALEDVASATVSGGNSSYNGYGVLQMNRPTLSNSLKAGVTHGKTIGTFTSDATITADQMMIGQTAYVNGEKITGTMANLGTLSYQPSDEEYIVPAGYTDGITIAAADITDLEEYQACLSLANSIDTEVDTSDATAKAEDIVEGKIAYSCGERLIGTLEKHNVTVSQLGGQQTSGWANTIYKYLTSIDGSDLTLVGNINYGLMYCSNLKKITNFDFSNVTGTAYLFYNCSALETIEINAPKSTVYNAMFAGCSLLKDLKLTLGTTATDCRSVFEGCAKLTEVPYLETSKATTMAYFCNGCSSLVTLPEYDTSSVSAAGLGDFIKNCRNLSDESLDNMLKMCLKSKVLTNAAASWRQLSSVGFTAAQLDRCLEMDSYKACLAAGWSRGV